MSLVPLDSGVNGELFGECHNLSADRLSAAWPVVAYLFMRGN